MVVRFAISAIAIATVAGSRFRRSPPNGFRFWLDRAGVPSGFRFLADRNCHADFFFPGYRSIAKNRSRRRYEWECYPVPARVTRGLLRIVLHAPGQELEVPICALGLGCADSGFDLANQAACVRGYLCRCRA